MNDQLPGASSPMTTSITLAQWVQTFLRWYPLRHGVVVGSSQQALQHLNAEPQALSIFKAHAPNAKASPHAANSFDWLIAAQNGPATLYQASMPSESGLLPPPSLKACWPGIQCVGQHELQARTLDAALQAAHIQAAPNWLWVGSVPAAPVLAGATQVLQQAEVLAVRVTLHPEAAAHAGLETVQALLAAQGLVLCGIEPERNPQLGTALFVRDHASAHAQTRQQLSASGQAQAQLQAKLQAESQALQAEAQAKTQAIAQRDALTKDNADLQTKLQAETQGRQAEAAAKAAMQQERDGLAQAQAQLQAKLDAESQALQAEAQAKNQAIAQCDALTKDKADLQAKLQAETQARQAEAAAKAAMAQQRDELTQAQAQLQAKLDAESQALQAEAQAKKQAIAQRDALTKDNVDLQTKLQAETQARKAEAAAKAGMAQQRDELTQAKAELQAKLDAENQALQEEVKTKSQAQALAIAQRDALTKDKAELQANLEAESKAKQSEAAAKAEAVQQREELAKAKAELQGKLETETKAKQSEAAAKAEAVQQLEELAKAKAELQAKLETETKARQAEAANNSEAIKLARENLKEVEIRLRNDMNKGLGNAVKQVESFMRIQSFLGDGDNLGEFHGWPISPDIGLFLLDRMREQHYDLIIEFGSGTSTALFARACEVLEQQRAIKQVPAESEKCNAVTKIISFEHDTLYFGKTQKMLKARGLDHRVQLVHAPLIDWRDGEQSYLYYDCQQTLADFAQHHFGRQLHILLLVDGPPSATCLNARYPAVPLVFSAFGRHQIDVVLDDANRSEEKQVIELWRLFLKQRSIRLLESSQPSEKGIYFACHDQSEGQ